MTVVKRKKVILIAVGSLLGILLIAVGGFVGWAQTALGPMPEAVESLKPDSRVETAVRGWMVFAPKSGMKSTGLIFYPGGRVDPRSYAPAMKEIAAQGYFTALVPMPFNLAVLGADKAGEIINAPPGFYATWSALLTQVESSAVKRWVIGGHSLGGAMAAQYAFKNPGSVKGLALWAAYPAGNNDLSGQDIAVVSIYGNRDGVAAPDEVLAAKTLLPRTTSWVEINGGNHSQFGWYGLQPGDNEAGITRENQQSQVVKATVELLQQVEKGW